MDPDTYLANLSSKKAVTANHTDEFDKKCAADGQNLSPWTDKKQRIPTAVEIMIKKKKDAQAQKYLHFTRNLGIHTAGLHTDYAGGTFIGSPFAADDETSTPLISMQPKNAILNQRVVSNGISTASPGGFLGKKITVSHDGTTTLIDNGVFNRASHDRSFKYSSEKKHHRSRQVVNMSKTTHGPGGGGGWAGNIVRAEHSPSNLYLLRQHSQDSEATSEHVYLDV